MPAEIISVHPVLAARDVTVSIEFYTRIGFTLIFQDDPISQRYAAVRRGPVELHLQWADPGQWSHSGDRPVYRFLTHDVDALHTEFLTATGLKLDNDGSPWAVPADTPWGTREFHVRDPGGNVLQFYAAR